jgi:hydrogenase maturation protein HypF
MTDLLSELVSADEADHTGPCTGSGRVRRRLRVTGVVQGVGFRPFVYCAAAELSLTGSVANDNGGVVIEVEGDPGALDALVRRVRDAPPPLAVVERVVVDELPARGGTGFEIADSSRSAGGRTLASPDVATCADCLRELSDPADRRHRHPFITCTNCGPRFTIIVDLPYDRAATTMAGFPMCSRCAREYRDPADRRFHAQPIACHDCGPSLELVDHEGHRSSREQALAGARALLAAGAVVAVKGLGGYHLACDAGNTGAVSTLRRRKRRGDKPFAVLVADLASARQLAVVDDAEAALLTGQRRPIVLVAKRRDPTVRLADAVAPGNPDLGIMLPYTPLHVLLLGQGGDEPGPAALVLTSGNLGGEPIVSDDAEARTRLAPLADAWLRHDRPIRVPCDDSVSRVLDGVELPIRRSRGYAPMPVALPRAVAPTLAVGADLKNTCAVAEGRYAWLSQHVGDMDDLATLDAFDRTQDHLQTLTAVRPERLVADRHPAYRSSTWARVHAGTRPVRYVQHHHAHIASVLGEHGHDGGEPVIGIAFDGTGYGTDGAVWGGEVLLADYAGFRRYAHLRYVPLPGGDAAVLRPYRMALSHLAAAGVGWPADLPPVRACPPEEARVVRHQIGTGSGPGLNTVPTSSMGRLFDAVSSIAGVRHVVDFEAQAAIELEGLSRAAGPVADPYAFELLRDAPDGPLLADASPVVRAAAGDVLRGTDPGVVGATVPRSRTGSRRRARPSRPSRHRPGDGGPRGWGFSERAAVGGRVPGAARGGFHRPASAHASAQRRRLGPGSGAHRRGAGAHRRERLTERELRRFSCVWQFPAGSSGSRSATTRPWPRWTSGGSARTSACSTSRTRQSATTSWCTSVSRSSASMRPRLSSRCACSRTSVCSKRSSATASPPRSGRPAEVRSTAATSLKGLGDEVPGGVQRPAAGPAPARSDPRDHHAAVGDHGGLRRADPLDHPPRHRPAAAGRDRDDPRAGLPGVRDTA